MVCDSAAGGSVVRSTTFIVCRRDGATAAGRAAGLLDQEIELRARLPIDAALLDVLRHADHREPGSLIAAARPQPLADRVLSFPERVDQRLVDDGDHAGRRGIGVPESRGPATIGMPIVSK